MKTVRTLILLLLALLLLSAGCTAQPQPDSAPQQVTEGALSIADMSGARVELPAPAQRIVALNAGDCEILAAIGAEATIIGRGEYCDYPAAMLELPVLQSGNDTNIEQIIALAPDAVVVSRVFQQHEQIEALKQAGLTVLYSDANSIDEVYIAIEMLGRLCGRETEAAQLAQQMQDDFASLTTVSGQQSVYFEVSPLEWGLWAAGTNTFMDEIAAMLGLSNAFADVEGWVEVSQEQVLQRDPDYIVTVTMYYGEGPTPDEEIMSRIGWEQMRAVQNRAIYCADSDSITRPGPRLAAAAKELSQFIEQRD